MSVLEPEEKAAGRLYREYAQAALARTFLTNPPHYEVPTFIAVYRHACPCRDERSTALELHEIYESSPRLVVETDDLGVQHTAFLHETWIPKDTNLWHVPAGRFGFLYKEGKCRLCLRTARSRVGRVVDAWNRPALAARGTR